MQKEELEKTKNWLVGDEKGVKLRACLVSPIKEGQLADEGSNIFDQMPYSLSYLNNGCTAYVLGFDSELRMRTFAVPMIQRPM